MILFGEGHLRRCIDQYLAHYHRERNHEGLGNQIIDPDEAIETGEIVCHERLGGLLNDTANPTSEWTGVLGPEPEFVSWAATRERTRRRFLVESGASERFANGLRTRTLYGTRILTQVGGEKLTRS